MLIKSEPLRKCLGCGEMKPKKSLIRIVRSPENEISLDTTGKKPGRGAYICADIDCFNKAKKNKRLERAFACRISEEVYDSLEEALRNG